MNLLSHLQAISCLQNSSYKTPNPIRISLIPNTFYMTRLSHLQVMSYLKNSPYKTPNPIRISLIPNTFYMNRLSHLQAISWLQNSSYKTPNPIRISLIPNTFYMNRLSHLQAISCLQNSSYKTPNPISISLTPNTFYMSRLSHLQAISCLQDSSYKTPNPISISLIPNTFYMTRLYNLPLFDKFSSVWWVTPFITPFIVQFPAVPFFPSIRTSRRIQHQVLGNLQPVFFFWNELPSFIFIYNKKSYTSIYMHFILLISTRKHSGPNASRHSLSTLNFKILGSTYEIFFMRLLCFLQSWKDSGLHVHGLFSGSIPTSEISSCNGILNR
jgi:hypothetical protein